MIRKLLEKLGIVKKKKKQKPVGDGYVTVSVRITIEQKEWLKEMKRRGIIGNYSQFFRRMIDMCMRGVIAQAREVVQREISYVVQPSEQKAPQQIVQFPVKQSKPKLNKTNPLRRELLRELKQVLKQRRVKIAVQG